MTVVTCLAGFFQKSVLAQEQVDPSRKVVIVFPYHEERAISEDAKEALSVALLRTPFASNKGQNGMFLISIFHLIGYMHMFYSQILVPRWYRQVSQLTF